MKNRVFVVLLLTACPDRLKFSGMDPCNPDGSCPTWGREESAQATVCNPADLLCYIPCHEKDSCPEDDQLCHNGLCFFDWVDYVFCNEERPCPSDSQICAADGVCRFRGAGPSIEQTVANCQNGADDDGDTFIDCADQDCCVFTLCEDYGVCALMAGGNESEAEDVRDLLVPEDTFRRCGDGLDNDGDGRTDCGERSCQRFTVCGGTEYETGPE